jgi:hypothetical protein
MHLILFHFMLKLWRRTSLPFARESNLGRILLQQLISVKTRFAFNATGCDAVSILTLV